MTEKVYGSKKRHLFVKVNVFPGKQFCVHLCKNPSLLKCLILRGENRQFGIGTKKYTTSNIYPIIPLYDPTLDSPGCVNVSGGPESMTSSNVPGNWVPFISYI